MARGMVVLALTVFATGCAAEASNTGNDNAGKTAPVAQAPTDTPSTTADTQKPATDAPAAKDPLFYPLHHESEFAHEMSPDVIADAMSTEKGLYFEGHVTMPATMDSATEMFGFYLGSSVHESGPGSFVGLKMVGASAEGVQLTPYIQNGDAQYSADVSTASVYKIAAGSDVRFAMFVDGTNHKINMTVSGRSFSFDVPTSIDLAHLSVDRFGLTAVGTTALDLQIDDLWYSRAAQ